jgi:hypothetical protein
MRGDGFAPRIVPDPDEDEAAAILAALAACLDDQPIEPMPEPSDRWSRAGRREAQAGLANRPPFERGWGA